MTACLAVEPEDRPPSAAALARMLAPVAAEAETVSLPADPSRRATEILAPTVARRPRPWTARRLAAAAALVVAALAGLIAALALNSGGRGSPPRSKPPLVAPPATGANAVEQANNIVDWLRRHSG